MARIPDGITHEDVRNAIADFNEGIKHGFGESTTYDVLIDGERYPPKAVVGLAARRLLGHQLTHDEFSGGKETKCMAVLEGLGFEILEKEKQEEGTIPELFVPGATMKRSEIHRKFSGQRYGGICTPTAIDWVLLFTGEAGKEFGYMDGFQEDGAFWYTGEGQLGDMKMEAGNKAIREHRKNGKSLVMFEIIGNAMVRSLGPCCYMNHKIQQREDRQHNIRDAIVFELEFDSVDTSAALPSMATTTSKKRSSKKQLSYEDLRALAIGGSTGTKKTRKTNATVRTRSDAVRRCVLLRANGVCEACHELAPFKKSSGEPYLEPHHIRRLADGGPDHPRWVAGICPNCHREIHFGKNGDKLNEAVAIRIGELDAKLVSH